jgi:hypothetical protein
MNTNGSPLQITAALGLAAAVAVLAVALGGAGRAGATSAPQGSQPIKSGAGRGWPQTLQPTDFVARVDNPWFPLKPGSRWRYRGIDEDGHFSDVVHVTHRTKTIQGVKATVVHDVVLRRGKPREVTSDWYAQDHAGNVWYFGENTRELNRHGHVTSREGSFRAGRDGARPGVLFPGAPRVGQKARQEYYKGHAEDQFKVLDLDARVSTAYISTRHAVRTKETSPLEPGVIDNKYYVRGVGDVIEVTVKGPKERLHLVSFRRG